jgi:hypothetical protein
LVEAGNELMTLRQAETAADVYDRPLAALFLPAPPEEEPQDVQFRRLPGAPEPPWGPEIWATARASTISWASVYSAVVPAAVASREARTRRKAVTTALSN